MQTLQFAMYLVLSWAYLAVGYSPAALASTPRVPSADDFTVAYWFSESNWFRPKVISPGTDQYMVPVGEWAKDTRAWTNTLLLNPAAFPIPGTLGWGGADFELALAAGVKLDYTIALDLTQLWTFFVPNTPGGAKPLLEQTKTELQKQNAKERVRFIYLIDEPELQKGYDDPEAVNTAARLVREYFPNVPIIVGYFNPEKAQIASETDWVGMTHYSLNGGLKELKQTIQSGIDAIKRKAPGKPILLTGKAFHYDLSLAPRPDGDFWGQVETAEEQWEYARAAVSKDNPEVRGVWWFLYPALAKDGAGWLVGAAANPKVIRAHKAISRYWTRQKTEVN